jgi:hypothetical protein
MEEKIYVTPEMLEKALDVLKLHDDIFDALGVQMEDLYIRMEGDIRFKSLSKDGYLEVLGILVKFHKSLCADLPEFYKKFGDFETSLSEIENTALYKGLDD